MKRLAIALTALLIGISAVGLRLNANAEVAAQPFTVKAHAAVLMDYDTGTVVFSQNEKDRLPIASMVKIMTLLLTFEEIDGGRLSVDDTVRASQNAASMGGSQAFLDANSDYRVNELIKSIVVGSANDSCVALAEHIGGTVEAFVQKMNEKAKALGMNDTLFANCTGLPSADQYCSAADVAIMTRELLSHSKFFDYSKIWMFDFVHPGGRVTQLSNTNKLIRAYEGCDGGKTGFTNEAKYCLSATAKRGNTRLISVVCGAESSKVRNAQNAAIFNYGFSNYETTQVVCKEKPIEQTVSVNGGKESGVCAYPAEDKCVFGKKGDKHDYTYAVECLPLKAPVQKGEVVGRLTVKTASGEPVCSVDLLSDRNVAKIGYFDLVDEFIKNW